MKARIKFSLGRTINTGNYENAKFDIGVEQQVDCKDLAELERSLENMKDWVKQRVHEEELEWQA